MRILQLGLSGSPVDSWQTFLCGQSYDLEVTNIFDESTKQATMLYQRDKSLDVDGVVGNQTFGAAMLDGFQLIDDPDDSMGGPNWPPPPSFSPLKGTAERQRVFGAFKFTPAGSASNPEAINMDQVWVHQNIVSIEVPQLHSVNPGRVQFHRLVADKVLELFQSWSYLGLIDRILSWGGSFAPRFVRGSRSELSNHSFGTAFDINVRWNYLGVQPALVGRHGSVRELVAAANAQGFYWGGHFPRVDGMHFEATEQLLST
jgi:hypothetical protein